MKTFRDYLSEEVTPTALSGGSVDIDNQSVRDEINGILSGIAMKSCVTPYNALTKIRKALAYFHISLPKRSYMEGKHGVEVWEIHQFGDKMGFTDSGEWIKSTPCKYYLFFHYHLLGSMFSITAKVVDKNELDKQLDFVEGMIKENAESRQKMARAVAPKEDQHTALGDCDCSQGDSPSTKKAVEVSMRRKDKKLSADQLDEISNEVKKSYLAKTRPLSDAPTTTYGNRTSGTIDSHINRAGDRAADSGKSAAAARNKKRAIVAHTRKLVKSQLPEETLDETRMPASVIKHKQRIANMTPEEKAKKFAGKSEEELKSMARRHGYGKDSNEYSKHGSFEKKLDEVSLGKLVRYKNKAGEGREKGITLADKKMKGKAKVNASAPKTPYMEGYASIGHSFDWAGDVNSKAKFYGKRPKATTTKGDEKDDTYKGSKQGGKVKFAKTVKEEQIDELKQATLKAYKSAAKADRNMSKEVVKKGLDIEGKFKHAIKKRKKGLERVSDRLAKEETQIDEISSGLKDRYAKKAKTDVWSRAYDAVNPKTSKDKAKSLYNKNQKRLSFIKKVEEETISEKAPPGAKFERMVKHIKKGYSKDGLTAKEKGIAYATAWKAKKKEQSED